MSRTLPKQEGATIGESISVENIITDDIIVSSIPSNRIVSTNSSRELVSADLTNYILEGTGCKISDVGNGRIEIGCDCTSSIFFHNNLVGLQGGIADEYYHQTYNQHSLYSENGLIYQTDGIKTIVDMVVDLDSTAGSEDSYSFKIDGVEFIKIYSESDGAGGLQNHRNILNYRVGINNNYPEVGLHVGDSTSIVGLTGINQAIFSGEVEFLNDIYIKPFAFGDDSGAVTVIDMNVTASSLVGTEQSISYKIDGETFVTLYSESDGSGGIRNDEFRIMKRLVLGENGFQEIYSKNIALDDDEFEDLPSNVKGFILVSFNDGAEYGIASFTKDSVVTLASNSANVVNTDTDTKYCIFDNGSNVRVRNRSGNPVTVSIISFISF